MATSNGSHSGFSPTLADSISSSSHIMSASMSSLSSSISSARNSSSHISKSYRQASTLFLTRRLPEALSTILPLITPPASEDNSPSTEPAPVAKASRTTRIKVWSLYLTILNAIVELDPDEGKDAFGTQEWRQLVSKVREGEVWEEVVRDGYHGVEGDVDSDVVINLATLLLAHARTQSLNQKRLESYLAAANTPNLDLSGRFGNSNHSAEPSPARHRSPHKGKSNLPSGAATPRDLNARVKILELYTLHVLLRNDEWDYAREFISMSSVLDDERREAFLQALQSLYEEQKESERREREEKVRQEAELRRDLEEARQLRAENEAIERKRVEEERARRAAAAASSEVDYGVEGTPSVAGSSTSRTSRGGGKRHARGKSSAGSGAAGKLTAASKKGKAAVAPPSLGSRAAMVLSNVRTLIEHLGSSFSSNPLVLIRTLAFIIGFLLLLSRKNIRQRISRVLGNSWGKVKATAGMGVKVSYI
ncbi:peroxin 26 [Coniochaeta sp. 2T2.1]|nr:peroxin 26 [Coniochaeta sp. 2T2.1]